MLHRKQFPLPVFIRKQDFSVKNAVAVAIGIAVKGTASVYAIELKDMAPEEIRKITEQRRREQQAYLLQNGSFESAGGWVLKKHDGAEGYMKIIDERRASLCIQGIFSDADFQTGFPSAFPGCKNGRRPEFPL